MGSFSPREGGIVILLGPPGMGKTHLSVALAEATIQSGFGTYFMYMSVRESGRAPDPGVFPALERAREDDLKLHGIHPVLSQPHMFRSVPDRESTMSVYSGDLNDAPQQRYCPVW